MEEAELETEVYLLSHGQQALWFFYQNAPDSPAFNIGCAVRIRSRINVPVLCRAVEALIGRHPSLRTIFPVCDDKPVQKVHKHGEMRFKETDASEWTWDELTKRVGDSYKSPFCLENGPLLRTELFTCSEDNHILLLTLHLIVCDSWSFKILMHELGTLYTAEMTGEDVHLPDTVWRYNDYMHWQREMAAGSEGEGHWIYWRDKLSGAPSFLDLSTDRPRTSMQSFHGASINFRVPEEHVGQLKRLALNEGATLSLVLLAAFEVMLSRYTGQEDFLLGVPFSCRGRLESQGLVGYLLNQAVIRADLSGDPFFKMLLGRSRQTVTEAFAHRDYPLPLLVKRLRPDRDNCRPLYFQVEFIDQGMEWASGILELLSDFNNTLPKFGALSIEPFEVAQQEGQLELILAITETRGALRGVFRYNKDLYDVATIAAMARHLQNLLAGIAINPDQKISKLSMLGEVERNRLLIGWNETLRDYPADTCIHQLFESQVEKTPGAVALVLEEEQMTYHELNVRANQLAHYLISQDVGPEVLVGICAEPSLEMVIGMLGVLKAGGAYVPLDPSLPSERLVFMIEDTGISVLLTQKTLIENLPANVTRFVYMEALFENTGFAGDHNPDTRVASGNLAYVMYTSGSTGRPKGVMISHKAMCNHMLWMQEDFPLEAADRVLQKTPFCFDASVWEYYAPLLAGASLVLARRGGHKDSAYLANVINKHQITVLQVVPSLLRMLCENNLLRTCNSLRRIFCGGEVLSVELYESAKKLSDADLINLYGPTEACIDATFWSVKGERPQYIIPIGRPIANAQVYILDSRLLPVPVGVAGEIHIGGKVLARGYLNRPELTAKKFIPDPFADEPGARLYRTGDLARYLPDGNIEFLGRIDHQVKIRGFRIELGEIEVVLGQHTAVREAVALVREDMPGDKRLIAYVASKAGSSSSTGELRRFLTAKLPAYMVPSTFVMLESLPLTANGKIDRRALPAPDHARPELEETFVAPRTPVEQALAEIWGELLGLERVGVHDNFFRLGGHSLLATQIISRLCKTFGINISLRVFFETPTISALSAFIDALYWQIRDKESGRETMDYFESGEI